MRAETGLAGQLEAWGSMSAKTSGQSSSQGVRIYHGKVCFLWVILGVLAWAWGVCESAFHQLEGKGKLVFVQQLLDFVMGCVSVLLKQACIFTSETGCCRGWVLEAETCRVCSHLADRT